ncbi:hypothetical protein GGD83_003047 [Rhodoblastus sphagnicola]|uniref:lysylphosphatidylglycerol synthase domain-containing protein n=1 Tax=Rhodoblastus sphagnicola TaxID=333368 RepID=UPI00130489B7|nr:lysylphosphatidylglycerol synthase domain-containing protein [Rhodoblastus sphagnicola]MBB4199233.1 hypothetical protein [Rhodoblastus sphagnicola]
MRNATTFLKSLSIVAGLSLAGLFLVYAHAWVKTSSPILPAWNWLLAAGAFYLLSHVLRALRLALIAAGVAPLRLRQLLALHFHAAPASLVLPFKLGDAYLIAALTLLSGDPGKAFLIALVQRVFDAIALIVFTIGLSALGVGFPEPFRLTLTILALVIGAGFALVFIAGPGLLALQDYVFTHHLSRDARFVLRILCSLRQAVELARGCAARNFAALLAFSLAVWLAEAATVASLAPALSLPKLADDFVGLLSFQNGLPPSAYGAVALTAIAVSWPFASFQLLRMARKPGRKANGDLKHISFANRSQPRRVRLHMFRRSTCSPD